MPDLISTGPKTLIVSRNMVEADDLTEMLMGYGLGPVAHARNLDAARRVLASATESLELLMFGLSLHVPETARFLSTLDTSERSLLVIDGPRDFTESKGAGVISRPFTTNDVMAALKGLGLQVSRACSSPAQERCQAPERR